MYLRALAITGAATAAAALLGSVASNGVRSRWYRRLRKPGFQPPPEVFPVVWTSLYADIAFTSAAALDDADQTDDQRQGFLSALVVNLALNAGWSWAFFRFHNLPLSVAAAAALAASSTDLARRAGAAKTSLGWALAPYALWCAYATVLTARIRALNS